MMGKIISINIPIKLESVANLSENRFAKSARQNKQKKLIRLCLNTVNIKIPCRVKLTRISPRELDECDNLRSSFKHVIDCVADFLVPGKAPGRADSCKEIKWEFDQKKKLPKEYCLNIEMEQL